jgi:hypothetical protein
MLSESVRNTEQSSLVGFGGGRDRVKTVSDRMKDWACQTRRFPRIHRGNPLELWHITSQKVTGATALFSPASGWRYIRQARTG